MTDLALQSARPSVIAAWKDVCDGGGSKTESAMKPIHKDELYQHVSEFLKGRGIELKEGSYTKIVQKSCTLLADTINLSQKGLERAKAGIDKKLDQVRQVIHEKTAPKPAANASAKGQRVAAQAARRRSSAAGKKRKSKVQSLKSKAR